jgi:hypothetical protein
MVMYEGIYIDDIHSGEKIGVSIKYRNQYHSKTLPTLINSSPGRL